MASPSQPSTLYHRLQAIDVTPRENLIVGYFVEPLNPSNLPQGGLVKLFQTLDLPFVKGPCFASREIPLYRSPSEVITAAL